MRQRLGASQVFPHQRHAQNALLKRERDEALEQQTATADVLRVISSSPGELEPVFEVMLQNAVHVCDAKFGNIYRWDGDSLHLLATHNTPRAFAEIAQEFAVSSRPAYPDRSHGGDQIGNARCRFGCRAGLCRA